MTKFVPRNLYTISFESYSMLIVGFTASHNIKQDIQINN